MVLGTDWTPYVRSRAHGCVDFFFLKPHTLLTTPTKGKKYQNGYPSGFYTSSNFPIATAIANNTVSMVPHRKRSQNTPQDRTANLSDYKQLKWAANV